MTTQRQEVIYGLTRGDEKVFYVGRSRNLETRLKQHRTNHGKDVTAVVLQDSFDGQTPKYAERCWIKKYELNGIVNIIHTRKQCGPRTPEAERKAGGVFMRFTSREKLDLEKYARADRRNVTDWIRGVLLDEISRRKESAVEQKSDETSAE